MNTVFKYKIDKKTYTCNFSFKFIEIACEQTGKDLKDIGTELFGNVNEPGTKAISGIISGMSKVFYYGVLANDYFTEQPDSVSLRQCELLAYKYPRIFKQVFVDGSNCFTDWMNDFSGEEVLKDDKQKKSK